VTVEVDCGGDGEVDCGGDGGDATPRSPTPATPAVFKAGAAGGKP